MVALLAISPTDADRPDKSPLVGKLAPAIESSTADGTPFSLDGLRGRWVLVNFFATWCAPCKVEHPELVRFAEEHGDASVVSVSFNDEPAAVKAFFETNGGKWPVVAEGNAAIALDYGVVKLPESYLVAPDGTVAAKFNGGVKAAEVDKVISDLGGSPP